MTVLSPAFFDQQSAKLVEGDMVSRLDDQIGLPGGDGVAGGAAPVAVRLREPVHRFPGHQKRFKGSVFDEGYVSGFDSLVVE